MTTQQESAECIDTIEEVRDILRQPKPSNEDIAHVFDVIAISPGAVYNLVNETANDELRNKLLNCQGNSPDVACNPLCAFRTDLRCQYDTYHYDPDATNRPPLAKLGGSGSKTAYIYGDKPLNSTFKSALEQAGYKSYQQFRLEQGKPVAIKPISSLSGTKQTSQVLLVSIVIAVLVLLCIAAYFLV